MQFDDFGAQTQSQTNAAARTCPRLIHAVKCFGQAWDGFCRHSTSGILNAHPPFPIHLPGLQRNVSAIRHGLARIVQQIDDQRLKQIGFHQPDRIIV